MVMGDDSCLNDCGFESWCCILDEHFFPLICCKNCIVCLKRPKINEKEDGFDPFRKHFFYEMETNVPTTRSPAHVYSWLI